MQFLSRFFQPYIQKYKDNGVLIVLYALLAEFLLLGYILFASFFTIETLLPGFVSERLSLSNFFALLLVLSFLLALLGRTLALHFPKQNLQKNPLLWIGILWAISILVVSLFQFPLWSLPLLIIGFLTSGFLAWKIFLEE